MSEFNIRPFIEDDYPAVLEIRNASYPRPAYTLEEFSFLDRQGAPKCKFKRWVVEQDGSLVGYGGYWQHPWIYHPQKFDLAIVVARNYRKRGIGSTLYDTTVSEVTAFDPILFRCSAYEEEPDSMKFAEKRGFTEALRLGSAHLDVNACDLTPYEELEKKLTSEGIRFTAFPELESDPDRNRKLFELEKDVCRDIPGEDNFDNVDFDTFVKDGLGRPDLLHDFFTVALDGDRYVGMCFVGLNAADNTLKQYLTGVRSEYRSRGIALALKARVIALAKKRGHPLIETLNDVENAPMLAVNNRLGFQPQPQWVYYEKKC